MNLTEWFIYLNNLPSGLTNRSLAQVRHAAEKLDLLNVASKIITVGGTNGKGSCVVFLEAIMLSAGYTTGAFISPHILRYNERIRLNGKDITNDCLIQAFAAVHAAIHDIELSYFEFTLLVALYTYKQYQLDILILEVGLGGRFDAVNILDADIAIITTVSLDHTQILGNTKEAIGYEKAGIMRANRPIIFGDLSVPKVIYEQAKKIGAILHLKPNSPIYPVIAKNVARDDQSNTHLHLPRANAETALLAINLLQHNFGFNVTSSAIDKGLQTAFLSCRYQIFNFNNREIILDVAHNEASAKLLAQNLGKNKLAGRTIAVMSMFGDKDIISVIQVLNKTINKWYISALDTNRGASLEQLTHSLQVAKVDNYIAMASVEASFRQALAECQMVDRIVVFGSFRTVAIILEIIKNES